MLLCGSTVDLVVHLLRGYSWNLVFESFSCRQVILDSGLLLKRSLQYRFDRLVQQWNYMESSLLEYKCEYLLPRPAVRIYNPGVGYTHVNSLSELALDILTLIMERQSRLLKMRRVMYMHSCESTQAFINAFRC